MSADSPTNQPIGRDEGASRHPDVVAVLEHFVTGKQLDPAIAERVRARAEQVTEAIRRDRGVVDDGTFQSLLDDEA